VSAPAAVPAGRRTRLEVRLWLAQRLSAVVLAACVVLHLATIIYAVRGGLSAGEILARTRGNVTWLSFYAVFAAAVAIHGSIGLRTIVAETMRWRGRRFDALALAFAVLVFAAGLRAAIGLYR
jgi:fumarate reductase subunit C